jgi:hypothetical protein
MRPDCMTDEEWDDWRRPIMGRPASGYPCQDCPAAFHREMRAIDRCNGYPGATRRAFVQVAISGGRRSVLPTEEMIERRRAQWRESNQRRRRGTAA